MSDIYIYVFVSYAIVLILFEERLSGKQGKNADLENLLQCIKIKKTFKPSLKIYTFPYSHINLKYIG